MVRIISVGGIDPATNIFTAKESIVITERAAVRFEIVNIGTKRADGWSFNAVLPTFPSHIFSSESQQALGPGDKIEYTLGFDQFDINQTEGVIAIYVDPTNSINEPNKDNNLGKATIKIHK